MRKSSLWLPAALLAAASLAGNGCVLLPEIKEKVVQLAAGGTTSVGFVAHFLTNNLYNQQASVDLANALDLRKILSDAGLDVSGVKHIKVSGISYRVTRPDPLDSRQIVNGSVTVDRPGVAIGVPIVTNFTETVNTVTAYKIAPVDRAGIALMNDLLADLLAAIQNNSTVLNSVIVCHLSGTSSPADNNTNFDWEIKVDISIVGEVKVSVPE